MENERNEAQLALEELKKQYGLTDAQLDNAVAAIKKVAVVALEIAAQVARAFANLSAACAEVIEAQAAEYREEIAQSIDFSACVEALQKLVEPMADELLLQEQRERSRCYDRTETRNGYYNAKLKNYRDKISRAAIGRPRRIARSCCRSFSRQYETKK